MSVSNVPVPSEATSLLQSETASSFAYAPQPSDAATSVETCSEGRSPASGTSRQDDPPGGSHLGLLSVTASAILFGLVAALVKLLAMDPYVVLQVRDTLQWLFSLGAVYAFVPGATTVPKLFGAPHQRLILLRSGLYWGFMSLYWYALACMPVGDATTLVYCSPLFTALFGWLLLGERVPPAVFGCLALSLIGVCLITQPAFLFGRGTDPTEASAQYHQGMLYAFGSAMIGGLLPVLVRKTRECHPLLVIHAGFMCSCLVFTPAAIVVRTALTRGAAPEGPGMWEGVQDPHQLFLLGLVALVCFAGLGLQTYGYQREQAARASAMGYIEIPFSFVLQYFMFGDLLTPVQGLGMLLVIASGLCNLYPAPTSDRKQPSKEVVPGKTAIPYVVTSRVTSEFTDRHCHV